jgi:CTP synthase (UTP-ammonia lyase)
MGSPLSPLLIALVGDFDASIVAHQAIPRALLSAAETAGRGLGFAWVASDAVGDPARSLARFDGIWCVPGSPYRSMDGVLAAIGYARRTQRPFMGTCGGFQHAVIEHARNDLGWVDAAHAETSPEAADPVIALLECGLVEATRSIRFAADSRIARAYGTQRAIEGYRCRYGVVPARRQALFGGAMRAVGFEEGDDGALGDDMVHALERTDHPFFVATLFQPERAALRGERVPLAEAFVQACGEVGFKAVGGGQGKGAA